MAGYWTAVTFEGWWKCHKCEREVNSAIWEHQCPECNHPKCNEECTDISPPASPAPIANDGVNYNFDPYYHTDVVPSEGPYHEAHQSSSSSGGSRRSNHKRQREDATRQRKKEHRCHYRGVQNEIYSANSGVFKQYTKFPDGADMYTCCVDHGSIFGKDGICPCGHPKCDNCTAA